MYLLQHIFVLHAVNEQDALQAAIAEIVKDSSKKKSRKTKTPSEKNSGSGPPPKEIFNSYACKQWESWKH